MTHPAKKHIVLLQLIAYMLNLKRFIEFLCLAGYKLKSLVKFQPASLGRIGNENEDSNK